MTWFSRMLDALYFRLGLNGPDGQPSQRKILTGAAVLSGCVSILAVGTAEVAKSGEVSGNFVLLVGTVIAGATGHSILRDKSAPSASALGPGRPSGATSIPAAPGEGANGGT